RITYYNEAVVALAGRRPELGQDGWCVTGRLYRPDGTPLPLQEYPMAVALKQDRPVRGEEAVAERPDGTRVPFIPYPTPLRDASGTLVGAVNMLVDITERKRAEAALRDSRAQLEKELAAAQRLQEASAHLTREGDAHALYDQILDAATGIMHAEMASMQMLDPERGELRLLAWRGFDPASAAFWEWVRVDSGSSCGMALCTGQRVIVPDIEICDFILGTPDFDAYRRSSVRAVQSTPLVSRYGRTLGMISTHWREPHQPAESDVRLLDVLARQAADLIERANAEAELRESEAQFHTLAESIPQLAWMARPDGWIFWYNQRWYNYTVTTLLEMQGWGWRKVHHPDHEQRVVERIQRSWDTGEPWEDTFPLRAADGGYRWFLSRARPIRDAEGRIVRWFGTNTDVTEQREAQEAQQRASQMLEERVAERTRQLTAEMAERRKVEAALQQARHLEAIGQLTGGVAHDFNNLLTVVAGQSEGIAAAAKDDDIRRRAAAIQRAAERGARLTGQLLAFARRQRLSPQRVTIARLMAEIDDLVRRAVGETVAVEFGADPDLWPSLVDPTQFESAILNLAINAKDAMPGGGRLAIVARNAVVEGVEASRLDIRPGDYVVVSVADTGTGMPADVRDHAFEPFFTTKDVGKGTGLGLAQTYGFVRQSGGAVALESTVGQGTTVSLHLPRAEAETIEELPLPSEPILPGAENGY
ncbi:MAG: PAS domain S-box protein, partial [Bradyrhizobium sp.]